MARTGFTFKSKNHPEANGRKPKNGDQEFRAFAETDDGQVVSIRFGREDMINFSACILRMLYDDPYMLLAAQEEAKKLTQRSRDE